MDTDILKPNTGYLPTERPVASHPTSPVASTATSGSPGERPSPYAEPVSEGEDDEEMNVHPAKDEDKRTGLTAVAVAEAIAFREKMLKERAGQDGAISQSLKTRSPMPPHLHDDDADDEGDVERAGFVGRKGPEVNGNGTKLNGNGKQRFMRALSIDPLAPSSAFDETLRNRLRGAKQEADVGRKEDNAIDEDNEAADDDDEEERDDLGEGMSNGARGWDDRVLSREFTAAPGKRIAVPVRIEPKVYFAAERTFLVRFSVVEFSVNTNVVITLGKKWLNTAVFIGTIATTLLNFVPADDQRGLISAALFTLCALLAVAYAGIIFVYRALRLRKRMAEGMYYDKYGPTILSIVLLAAMGTNIGLRWTE